MLFARLIARYHSQTAKVNPFVLDANHADGKRPEEKKRTRLLGRDTCRTKQAGAVPGQLPTCRTPMKAKYDLESMMVHGI